MRCLSCFNTVCGVVGLPDHGKHGYQVSLRGTNGNLRQTSWSGLDRLSWELPKHGFVPYICVHVIQILCV